MVENRLLEKLTRMDFTRLDTNTQGIYLYYKIIQQEAYVIPVMQLYQGNELAPDQYEHIVSQIRNNFLNKGYENVRLLSLILTRQPDSVRQFCLTENDHWIVDLSSGQLLIFETQSSDFLGLKDVMEDILEQEQHEVEIDNHKPAVKNQWITPVNITLIAINIIIYMVVYYTRFLGDSDKVIKEGALSWLDVTKHHQYYRLITAMFLHANLEHIFNNMLVLLFVGVNVEKLTGKFKYLFIYFGAGIIAGISSIGYNMWKGDMGYGIGASGAIFGVVGAMLFILIVNKGKIEEMSIGQLIIFALLSLYGGFVNAGVDNTAHIGGFIGGFLLASFLYRKPKKVAGSCHGSY